MKAYVLEGVNDLRYEEVELPQAEEGWAVVRVLASGICSSDIPRIFIKGTYHFPTIPGHEYSGVVESVGSEADRKWIGKKVGIFPLIPCRTCPQCAQKKYEMCTHYDYSGSRRNGGFAEYVDIPVWNLIELPEEITPVEAAMLEPLSVALHAAKRAEIREGDKVAVIGTGMIGISVAKWAQKFKACAVTVFGRSENKRKLVENVGGIDYKLMSECTAEYDRVIEAVGTPDAIESALNCAKPEAHVVLMGNPSGDITIKQNVYWQILRRQLTLTGTWNSSYESGTKSDWTEAVEAIKNKEIDVTSLVSHTFSKEEMMRGLDIMRNHTEPYCKVMIDWQ